MLGLKGEKGEAMMIAKEGEKGENLPHPLSRVRIDPSAISGDAHIQQ